MTDVFDVERSVSETIDRLERIDILVCNAGIGTFTPPAEATLEHMRSIMEVNLWGAVNMVKAALPHMMRQGEGHIVFVGSVGGKHGFPRQAAYSASKGGVAAMTLPIARELARFGVRVMTIAPGLMSTPMLHGMPDEVQKSLGAQVPFPARLGRPEEYAALVVHIAENPMLNGEVIRLDGAIRMQPE